MATRRLIVLGALAALLAVASGALAHADLTRAEPQPNTRVDTIPQVLEFSFSEPIETTGIKIELVDRDGRDPVERWEASADRTRVTAHLAPLPEGLYTVRWQVLSTVDGHTTRGAYLLGVGTDIPEGAIPEDEEVPDVRAWETVARAIAYGGASLLVGVPLFLLWTKRQGVPANAPRLLRVAGLAGLVAAAAVLIIAGGLAVQLEATVWEAIRTTSYGGILGWRTLLLAAAGLIAYWAAARDADLRVVALALLSGLAALLMTSLGSHAAAVRSGHTAAVAADFIHQVAAAAWIGGLIALATLLTRRSDPETAYPYVARFSPLALTAVLVLIATGVYGALLHLDDPLSPSLRPYTLTLLAKVALLLPLLVLGAVNRYRLQPRLQGQAPRPAMRRLRATVALEVLLLAIVLVLTGALTHAPPPAADDPYTPPHGALPGEVLQWRTLDGHEFRVTVAPFPTTIGVQNVTLHFYPGSAGIPENAVAYLTDIEDPTGENTLDTALRMTRWGETKWSASGVLFPEEGGWHVTVLFQGRGVIEERDIHIEVTA